MNLYSVALSRFGRADQCNYIVAAPSKKMAYRALLEAGVQGLSRYAFDQYGSSWNPDSPSGRAVLAEPGVVFWQPLDPGDRDVVLPLPKVVDVDAEKAAAAAEKAARQARIQASRDRRTQAHRAAVETLARVTPMLEELGLVPTVVSIEGGSFVVPPEFVESLVQQVTDILGVME